MKIKITLVVFSSFLFALIFFFLSFQSYSSKDAEYTQRKIGKNYSIVHLGWLRAVHLKSFGIEFMHVSLKCADLKTLQAFFRDTLNCFKYFI